MRALRAWLIRLGGLFGQRDREFDAELESHLQLHIDDGVRAGLTSGEARRRALIKLGGLESVKERHRDRRGFPFLEPIVRDVRFSVRLLRRSPGFAAAAVLPVALGIAATTTLFSVVHGVLLRPLPYADADRLVHAVEREAHAQWDWTVGTVRRGTFDIWRDEGTTIEAIAGYENPLRTLRTGDEPLRLKIGVVSSNMFDLLGASPLRGRFFQAGEDRNEGAGVAVLSYGLWVSRFGGEDRVIGRVVTLDDRTFTVVGITRPEFYFPDRSTELWVPKIGSAVVARLRRGTTVQQAEAESTAIAERVRKADAELQAAKGDKHVAPSSPRRVRLTALLDAATRSVRKPLLVMMGAAIVVLIVAVANAANLLLVRSMRRGRELAVRAALGGSASRIARELFIDSAVIGAAAGGAGLLLAMGGHRALLFLLPRDFPRLHDIAMDWRVVGFGFGLSMLATIVAGMAPVLRASKLDLNRSLHATPGTSVAGGRRIGAWRFSSLVVVGEIALCCALLVGAGLLTRSFLSLSTVEKGYEPANALAVQVSFSGSLPQVQRRELTARILERVAATRPVQAAGITNALPLEAVKVMFSVGRSAADESATQMDYRVVSPGYFAAAGMRLATGRAFDGTESPTSEPVVMVNEAFVRRYAPEDPTRGFQFPTDSQRRRWRIVGVVRDVRDDGPAKPSLPTIYRSYLQTSPTFFNRVDLVVRTPDNPLAFMPTLRRIVRETDPQLALYLPSTMEEQLEQALARPRLYSVTLIAFAGFVLAIIGTGLFGMLAYAVAQRRREIAVRMALGATVRDVLSLVLGRVAGWTLVGIAAGIAGGALVSRLLAGLIFGIVPLDPATFVSAPIIVTLVALLAALAPLRRALGVQPASALRAD